MTLSKAFARIFWAIAGALVLVAAVFAVINLVNLSGSAPVEGRIREFEVVRNAIPFTEADSGLQYYPVLEYEGPDGTVREYTSPQPVSPENYQEGDVLGLRLFRDGSLAINSFLGLWGRPLVFLATAAGFFIFGFGALRSFDSKKY